MPVYEERKWDDKANKVGYLIGTVGLAGLFAASAIELIMGNAALGKVEAICASVVSATVVAIFALPIAKARKERRAQGRETRSPEDASQRTPQR